LNQAEGDIADVQALPALRRSRNPEALGGQNLRTPRELECDEHEAKFGEVVKRVAQPELRNEDVSNR
jgi:hypothetical protein